MTVTEEFSDADEQAVDNFRAAAIELQIDFEGLSDDDLIRRVLDAPGGQKLVVGQDAEIHPAARALFRVLSREDGYVDSGSDWIAFNSDDAYIEASVKQGTEPIYVLSVDAHLLSASDRAANESDVRAWIDAQPEPGLGLLSVGSRAREDGSSEHMPLLSVDVAVDSIVGDFLRELIYPFAEAWDNRTVAIGTEELGLGPGGHPYRVSDPVEAQPRNAWLLVGSEENYPSMAEMEASVKAANAGLYDDMWTAPKNGEYGDLVLTYFMSPRKAVHFVARLASKPFWRTDIEVVAGNVVNKHQWWAYLTPFVEIEPVTFKTLQEAQGGYLPLKGRSGHHLHPDAIQGLQLVAKDPNQQGLVDQVAQRPVGSSELPDRSDMSFEEWTQIPSGLLPLEARVSEYIVEPLERFLFSEWRWTAVPHTLGREYRVPSGYVDFVVRWGNLAPLMAIEVKLAIERPSSGVWTESPDFRQLLRYMADLDAPGLLIDANSILLVEAGADRPHAEVRRLQATFEDLVEIRRLVDESWDRKHSEALVNGVTPQATWPDRESATN